VDFSTRNPGLHSTCSLILFAGVNPQLSGSIPHLRKDAAVPGSDSEKTPAGFGAWKADIPMLVRLEALW
jgi:hypothetical protein